MSEVSDVKWDEYDFIDLGCSNGGSIRHCLKRFGARKGLGIDLDPAKVEKTRAAGFDAIVADARELDLDRQVSFVTMLDFCEHLPSAAVVEDILAAAARSARDFIYIKHPSFEGQELVESMGLRQYWWDWHGHTAHVRVADYCSIFDRLGLNNYLIRHFERIDDSMHPSIMPTTMPMDRSAADAEALTEVPFVQFSPPLWRRQDIFVALRAFSPEEWAAITKPTKQDLKVMTAAGQTKHDPAAYQHVALQRNRAAAASGPDSPTVPAKTIGPGESIARPASIARRSAAFAGTGSAVEPPPDE